MHFPGMIRHSIEHSIGTDFFHLTAIFKKHLDSIYMPGRLIGIFPNWRYIIFLGSRRSSRWCRVCCWCHLNRPRLGLAQIHIRIIAICLLHTSQKKLHLLTDIFTALIGFAILIQLIDLRPHKINRTQNKIRNRRTVYNFRMALPYVIKNILHRMGQCRYLIDHHHSSRSLDCMHRPEYLIDGLRSKAAALFTL